MRKKLSALGDAVSSRVSSLGETFNNWFDGKTALGATFAGSIVTANILASKVAAFDVPFYGEAFVPAGFIGLGLAFLASDTLSELYGPEAAHKVVNGTVVAVLASLGLIHLSVSMPSAPFYQLGQEYSNVLMSSTSLSIASVATMVVSQNIDVSVFHKMKEMGLPKWARNTGSTAVSQLIDTALFILLGFTILPPLVGGSFTPLYAIPSLIVSQYIMKLVVAVLDTPLFYLLTGSSE